MTYTLQAGRTRHRSSRPDYYIVHKDGDDVGTLRRSRSRKGWELHIKGKLFSAEAGGAAERCGIKEFARKGFKTLAAARAFLRDPEFAPPR